MRISNGPRTREKEQLMVNNNLENSSCMLVSLHSRSPSPGIMKLRQYRLFTVESWKRRKKVVSRNENRSS